MPKIYLIEGPIGAGKSTYANELGRRVGAPWLCLDEWIAKLYLADRPAVAGVDWYLERKTRCEAQIWRTALSILGSGSDVILELGLLSRNKRESFCSDAVAAGYDVYLHVIDAPEAVRRERVRQRNLARGPTWQVDITDEMFVRSNGWWEPLTESEYDACSVLNIDST